MQLPSDVTLSTAEQTDAVASLVPGNPLLNSISGTVGKAFDTFVDAAALGYANKLVGTVYPTGQQNPAAVAAKAESDKQVAAATSSNLKTVLIVGAVALVGITGIIIALTGGRK